ncbi:serine hydrolase domain-containing protein [Pedobacter deserti]|uniref:serine hydrolase domain-containing protein n=1 Tax=Pedobacter deserti TaxID=2817382 RepID=UPI002109F4BA|nr:serine hydrolase domain-containing protein [Pedobacter sp. SYSU D00382]
MKKIVLLLSMLGLFGNVAAQHLPARLDSFYSSLAAEGRLNGGVLVASKGQVLYERYFGWASIQHKRRNEAATAFQLASLSKPFTAVAIMQLAETGKLNLSERFSHYFPQFPYKDITIAQLLSHSSGLSDQDLSDAQAAFERRLGRRHCNADLVAMLAEAKVKLKLKPGEKWWYSNLGFELLATLVEKVSGLGFPDYLNRYIWSPAGMEHTYLRMSQKDERIWQARNYDYPKRYAPYRERVDNSGGDYTERAYGHSNIVSTCRDLLRFSQAFFGGRLVSPAMVTHATAGTSLQNGRPNAVWMNIGSMGSTVNGLGWFVFNQGPRAGTVFHAGGMSGAVTILLFDPSSASTVIILDNMGSEGIYNNALNGLRLLNGRQVVPSKKNLARLYGRWLMTMKADAAAKLLMKLRNDTLNYTLNENDINNLGYALLSDKIQQKALEVFKINCVLFPASDNAFNSYAEALEQIGQQADALDMYRKSVQLNPGNQHSLKALRRLESTTQ